MSQSVVVLGRLFAHEVSQAMRRTRRKLARDADSRVAPILARLDERGIARIDGYWPAPQCAAALDALGQVEASLTSEQRSQCLQDKAGALRIHHVEKFLPAIARDYFDDPFILAVAREFYGVPRRPTKTMYARTAYSATATGPNPDFEAIGFGRTGYHMDLWAHQLKTMLFLADVGPRNGPFLCCPGTHHLHFRNIRKMYEAGNAGRLNHGRELYYSPEEASRLGLDRRAVPVIGPAGTLVFVDTRAAHRAAILEEGERHILWNYFK